MKIINIKLNNFLSFPEAEITINNKGFIILYGKNLQDGSSIGIGKTTIKRAILFALFGKTDLLDADNLITYNKTNLLIELTFFINNKTYKIIRTRTLNAKVKTTLELFVLFENKFIKIPFQTITLLQKEIERILNINYEKFCLIYCFGQSEFDDIKLIRGTKLIDLFLNFFELMKFDKIIAYLKKKQEFLKEKLIAHNEQNKILEKLNNYSLEELDFKIYLLNKNLSKIRNYAEKILLKSKFLDSLLVNLTGKFNIKNNDFILMKDKIQDLKSKLEKINSFNGVCPTCGKFLENSKKEELIQKLTTNNIEITKNLNLTELIISKYIIGKNNLNKKLTNITTLKERIKTIHYEKKEKLNTLLQLKNIITNPTLEKINSNKINLKIDHLTNIIKIFDKQGFSLSILEESLSLLEETTNTFLNEVSNFRISFLTNKITKTTEEVKPDLLIKIYFNDLELPLDNLSNGQTVLINLSLRIALSTLFKNLFKTNIDILIIDDEFGKLDEVTNSKILKLLEVLLLKNYFYNIMIMTHNKEIKDNIDSSLKAKDIKITFENNESKIVNF